MTTPTLGDLTQVPVGVRPSQAVPPLGVNSSVIVYNQDVTNIIYASYQAWFTPNSGVSIPIQPLTSVTLSAKRAIYLAATTTVSNAIVVPAGSVIQPSPGQIATQIAVSLAAGGIPLLTQSSVLAQASGQVIAANGSLTIPATGTLDVTQIGHEMVFRARYNTANGTNPFYQITINWFDSTTGNLVDTDIMFSAMPAFNDATTFATRIKGTTKGNRVQVIITNLDTAQAMNLTYTLLQNSRVYPYELDITWIGANPTSIPTFTLPQNLLPDTHTMGVQINGALAVGFEQFLFPPQIGVMYINVWESGVSAANMNINGKLQPNSIYGLGGVAYLFNDVFVAGNPNKYNATFFQGGCPLLIRLTNSGTVAASYNMVVTSGTK